MFRNVLFLAFITLWLALCGQTEVMGQTTITDRDLETGRLFRPKIHLGFGSLDYFGDVGHLNGMSRQSYQNWGYNVMMQMPIDNAFHLNVFALFGKMSARERLMESEHNFQTAIGMGGLSVTYNFDHLLPKERILTPFVGVGITTFEFNPKGNLKDATGNPYYHWSDGTLRDRPQNSPDAIRSNYLERDQTFETDLRSQEQNGQTYALRAFSIPVSAGVDIAINDKFNLRLSSEMHFTNTDYIDGIAYNPETGAGRKGNDRFLFSSVGLTYNMHHTPARKSDNSLQDTYEGPGYELDEDGDGVPDFSDLCPFTPEGVQVDLDGCPLDSDGDGVPDYLDKEPNSTAGSIVNHEGIALTDAHFEDMYKIYLGEMAAPNIEKSSLSTADIARNKVKLSDRTKGYRLVIKNVDEFESEQVERLLAINDVKLGKMNGRMEYFAGDYNSNIAFMGASLQLKNAGFEYDVFYNDFGNLTPVDPSLIFDPQDYDVYADLFINQDVNFRVQIGAFSKKVSPKLFEDVRELLVIPGSDGLTRYVSGSFDNLQDAAKHRVNLLLKGYEGAFVTAYRSGKRISLKEAGATIVTDKQEAPKPAKASGINKDFVSYSIQLGEFKGRIPAETLSEYMGLGNVRPIRNDNGVTKYIHGNFKTMAEAKKSLAVLQDSGFDGVAIVGQFNGQIIDAKEALEIRGE